MSNNNHEIVDSIIASNDIVDVINSFVTLSKKGRSFVCICPFHQDTNPSMNVDPKKQIFKCFVCQVGGNVLTFLMKYKKWTFQESLEYLANRSNINVDLSSFQKSISRYNEEDLKIIEINNKANSLFKLELIKRKNKELKDFIHKRALTSEIIQAFDIGYSEEESFNSIFANELENIPDLLVKASLINSHNKSVAFKNRITFAIKDEQGEIVGFSARALDNDTKPKYINSNETKLFKKNSLLYNYWQANSKSEDNSIIITEGFFDVIALFKAEIYNAVGLMGTALTNNHFRLLKNKKVVIFLDGDDAGQKASLKSAKFLLDHRIDTYIVRNTTKYDPDELFNSYGADILHKLIKEAPAALDFIYENLSKKYNLSVSPNNEIKNVKAFCNDFVNFLEHQEINVQEFYKNKIQTDYGFSIQVKHNFKLPDPYDSQEIYAPQQFPEDSGEYQLLENNIPPYAYDEQNYNQVVEYSNNVNNFNHPLNNEVPLSDYWINNLFYLLLNHTELIKLFKEREDTHKDLMFFGKLNNEDLKKELYQTFRESKSIKVAKLKEYIKDLEQENVDIDLNQFSKKYKEDKIIKQNFKDVYRRALKESDNAYNKYTSNPEVLKQISSIKKMYDEHKEKLREMQKRKEKNE
ncbi:hypothetical protein MBIO_0586 [Mycoplasmopsis fermentans PG18]|uniref:DNA primase n=1 Tax=Mycoplasmopsis fermentans (strain ATCC 19989 / NBRC 14854 / NCTC 10117 / PG18) TaxID=496833 RepID=C4XFC9_MYCFP|nr:DNA primase [Mycoplasmopsis fermentans]BAH69851.1 hypothetical protein MBIO_0586 [Mycoplasmopsis fermentans PG18]VEU64164.1 DNA primase [Mycoplasmopsis fermentans]VEU67580.1 DNA primase [Mesomycoplasma conjunctivae]